MTIRIRLAAAALVLALCGSWLLTPRELAVRGAGGPLLGDMIPRTVGDWQVDDTLMPVLPQPQDDDRSLAARIYDQTVVRTYRNAHGDQVMLVAAYGRDQSDSLQLHRPEICYRSQGFQVSDPVRQRLSVDRTTRLPVVRLITRQRTRHEPVTYWTRVGDAVPQTTLSRQWTKLLYGLRGKRPDGVLVRVSTISREPETAFATQDRFIRDLFAAMDRSHRPFFMGRIGAKLGATSG